MQRFTASLAVCGLCWVMNGIMLVTGLSDFTLNFLAIYNGYYDDSVQVHNGFTKHELITGRIVPVDIHVLRPAPVVYAEWAVGDNVVAMDIGVVTEGPGQNIYITLYNFTDPRLFKFVFVGSWPDCNSVIRMHHPDYADTVMCDSFSVVMPPTVQNMFEPVPYVFQRKGPRYPLIGRPDTYDSICGKTG